MFLYSANPNSSVNKVDNQKNFFQVTQTVDKLDHFLAFSKAES